MSNPQTAEEWKTVAANASAQIKEIEAQAAAATAREAAAVTAAQAEYDRLRAFSSNPKNFDLKTPEGIASFKAAKAETTAYKDNQLNSALEAQSNAEQQFTSQINQLRQTQANADRQASAALTGPPNTSPNTPPATTQPNTDPTTVTTTTVPNINTGTSPTPVTGDDPEFGNLDAAIAAAAEIPPSAMSPTDIEDPFEAARLAAEEEAINEKPIVFGPGDVDQLSDEQIARLEAEQAANRQLLQNEDAVNAASEVAAASQAATIIKAKEQATLAARYKSPANADWRVRLILPEQSDFLYKANPPGILKPLAQSNGVVFPYTPQIQTSYSANYEQYDLVHSNYRGYFYKNSKVGDININAVFTAQDTQEAEYMLAVIHFFRSVTKMFYGKDGQRGAPPPLVYLVGLGDYQFNGHPCLVSNFTYNLPNDVDYIRANNPNNFGTNMLNRVSASTSTSNILPASVNRLANAIDNFGRSLQLGALPSVPSPATVPGSVNNLNRSTYVPTKIEISITLLPVQTRAQVSKQFSLKGFANGDLLKGGFW